jgi:hypothetical protein
MRLSSMAFVWSICGSIKCYIRLCFGGLSVNGVHHFDSSDHQESRCKTARSNRSRGSVQPWTTMGGWSGETTNTAGCPSSSNGTRTFAQGGKQALGQARLDGHASGQGRLCCKTLCNQVVPDLDRSVITAKRVGCRPPGFAQSCGPAWGGRKAVS